MPRKVVTTQASPVMAMPSLRVSFSALIFVRERSIRPTVPASTEAMRKLTTLWSWLYQAMAMGNNKTTASAKIMRLRT